MNSHENSSEHMDTGEGICDDDDKRRKARKVKAAVITLAVMFASVVVLLITVTAVKLIYTPEKQAEKLLEKYYDIVRLPEYATFTDEDLANLDSIERAIKYLEEQPELKGLTFNFVSYTPKDEEFMQEEVVLFEPRDLRKLRLPANNYLVVGYSEVSKKYSSNIDFILNYSEYQQAMEELTLEVLEITEDEKIKVTVLCYGTIEKEDVIGVNKRVAIGNLYDSMIGEVFMQADEAEMDASLERYKGNMSDLLDEHGTELNFSVSLGEGYDILGKLYYSFTSTFERGQRVYKYDYRKD